MQQKQEKSRSSSNKEKKKKQGQTNPSHREDFFKLLRKASQDQKEDGKT